MTLISQLSLLCCTPCKTLSNTAYVYSPLLSRATNNMLHLVRLQSLSYLALVVLTISVVLYRSSYKINRSKS